MSPLTPHPPPISVKTIYVSNSDYTRLSLLARSRAVGTSPRARAARQLLEELDRATLLPAHELPPEVVQLDSEVTIEDLENGETESYTVTLPDRANADEGRISVLTPIGTALLGYAAGDDIAWPTPGGLRKLRIRSSRPASAPADPAQDAALPPHPRKPASAVG